MADLTCPFCNEREFDAIGLKQHLQRGWCDAFEATPLPGSMRVTEVRLTDEQRKALTVTRDVSIPGVGGRDA